MCVQIKGIYWRLTQHLIQKNKMKPYALRVIITTLLLLTVSCQSTKNLGKTNIPVFTEQAPKASTNLSLPPSVSIGDTIEDEGIMSEWRFSNSPYWAKHNFLPALVAFEESCKRFSMENKNTFIHPRKKELGTYGDWISICLKLKKIEKSDEGAKSFFEREFKFIQNTQLKNKGILTGYYEPIIDVRKTKDNIYSEPILKLPTDKEYKNLTRSKIKQIDSDIIAFAKPIDVFFMQIQGSGKIKFKNGKTKRAAYSGNNGKPYVSIGQILINEGELLATQASKQSIEKWMWKAGHEQTKRLINKNPRYVFFKEEEIANQKGPLGAMRVALTDMASLASDPNHNPYGLLVWLETKIPKTPGDYVGHKVGLLASIQDTGSAIKGPFRGDLYFGSGVEAGLRAGVMKHKAEWKFLVPKKTNFLAEPKGDR